MIAWTGPASSAQAPAISLTVPNPVNLAQNVTVNVPREVSPEGVLAVLVVQIACDLESLFTENERRGLVSPIPPGQAVGAAVAEVSVLLQSSPDSTTFIEVPNDRVAMFPITVTMNGLALPQTSAATFFTHETEAISDPFLVVGDEGTWSNASISNTSSTDVSVTAQTHQSVGLRALLAVAAGTRARSRSPRVRRAVRHRQKKATPAGPPSPSPPAVARLKARRPSSNPAPASSPSSKAINAYRPPATK